MKREIAQMFVDFSSTDEISVVENYSGRGMFGGTTTGISLPEHCEIFDALSDVLEELSNDPERLLEVAASLKHLRSDNMGRGTVYY